MKSAEETYKFMVAYAKKLKGGNPAALLRGGNPGPEYLPFEAFKDKIEAALRTVEQKQNTKDGSDVERVEAWKAVIKAEFGIDVNYAPKGDTYPWYTFFAAAISKYIGQGKIIPQ